MDATKGAGRPELRSFGDHPADANAGGFRADLYQLCRHRRSLAAPAPLSRLQHRALLRLLTQPSRQRPRARHRPPRRSPRPSPASTGAGATSTRSAHDNGRRGDRDPSRARRPADPAHRRRRPQRVARRRPRSAPPLRRGLPGDPGRLRTRSPRGDQAGRTARRAGGGHPGRLPDAADERGGLPRGGDGPGAAGPPRPAHRVRGHRCRDRRDQPGRRGPLPAQAVGAAGGEALPGGRRAGRRLAARGEAGRAQDQDPRPPLVVRLVRGARLPRPQSGALPLVHRGRSRRGPPARRRGRRSE